MRNAVTREPRSDTEGSSLEDVGCLVANWTYLWLRRLAYSTNANVDFGLWIPSYGYLPAALEAPLAAAVDLSDELQIRHCAVDAELRSPSLGEIVFWCVTAESDAYLAVAVGPIDEFEPRRGSVDLELRLALRRA